MDKSEKLGFIHKKSSTSKLWTKYICVMKGSYIYMYSNRKNEKYD